MYFRLLLPQMLQACERVIYLDCDLLVETDLEALWTMDLGGCAVAGWDEGEPQHLERLGLADDCYVNSGVLVMDLERWRDQAYGQACMDWIEAHSQAAVLPDQDAMNVVLRGSKARLAEHWNLNPVWREESDLLTRYPERVIHFGGPVKPWDACYDFELAQRFKRYVDFSPWKAVFPFREPKNPTQLVILAHQLADAGEVEGSCRRYHAALMAMAEKRGALSPLVVQTINHAVRHYGLKRYAEAIEHFKDAVEFFGLPRHYSKNIYRLGGLLEGMF
jgi:lipopolysaccharide biosynthesis glycosyltransferase